MNEVLGKMSVSEAEEVVEQLGEGGMLSLEQGVIDGTTEEGREKLKALEEEARREKDVEGGEPGDAVETEAEGKMRDLEMAEDGKAGAVEIADVD